MLPMISRVRRWPLVVMAFAVIIAATAQTASNTVPSTKVVDNSNAIGANNLKPTECGSITLTTKVTGSGTINGTSAAELLTGSTVADDEIIDEKPGGAGVPGNSVPLIGVDRVVDDVDGPSAIN